MSDEIDTAKKPPGRVEAPPEEVKKQFEDVIKALVGPQAPQVDDTLAKAAQKLRKPIHVCNCHDLSCEVMEDPEDYPTLEALEAEVLRRKGDAANFYIIRNRTVYERMKLDGD